MIVLTLTEDQFHVLSQALHGRKLQLEQRAETHPHMLSAVPVLTEIETLLGYAFTAAIAREQVG
jgi:hypothetical protein